MPAAKSSSASAFCWIDTMPVIGIGTGRSLLYTPPVAGGALGLQTNLTAFWSLENTSWTDDTGNGTTLTGTGSPTTTTGKVGNGASLVASTSYLQCTSNTNILNGGSSFSVQVWANATTPPGEWLFFNKSNDAFANREWGLGTRFTGSFSSFSFRCDNTSSTAFRAEDSVAATTGSFVHLVGTFNSSTGAMILYKNGSQVGTATLTGTMTSSASAPLSFNAHNTAIGTQNFVVDQAGFWKGRVLSAADVTALYNSGNGLSYAAMA
jgi:hypothetical protein